jgi:hypothetical protein
VLDPDVLAEALDARKVRVPARLLRSILWATWRSRLQPSHEGWLDMALGTPIMDTTRIRRELAWTPAWTATDALLDLLTGMREKAGGPTAPLHPDGRGPVEPILTPLAPVSESA